MPDADVLTPPATMEPAGFFAAPPQTPTDLVQARRGLLADPSTADKFAAAVRESRAKGDPRIAAAGSWVLGHYLQTLDLVQGDDELATFLRGSSLLELRRLEEARTALDGAWKASDPVLAATALHALAADDDYATLAKVLPKASLAEPDGAYFAARLLEAEGRYAEACAAYEEILAAHPEHLEARFRLALRADLHGDDEAALAHYEALLQQRPVPVAVLLNLGVLYEDRNDYEKACGCYSAILKRDPNHPQARLYFRDAHESLDMYYDEDLERREDRLMKVLRTPITEFELSVRARNCLQNMDIRTLGDLVSHTEQELMEFKNFGETSLNEIKRLLAARGLRLGLRREDGSFIVPDEFETRSGDEDGMDLSWLGEVTDEMREAMELQISALNLSVRCHRALVERLNLQKVADILRYTEEDLLSMPNFGITSLNELRRKLEELDLRLRTGRGEEYEGDAGGAGAESGAGLV